MKGAGVLDKCSQSIVWKNASCLSSKDQDDADFCVKTLDCLVPFSWYRDVGS